MHSTIQTQERRLHRHEKDLCALRQELQATNIRHEQVLAKFGEQLTFLTTHIQQMSHGAPSGATDGTPAPVPVSSPVSPADEGPSMVPVAAQIPIQLSRPEKFSGDSGDCRPFLTQCELHFELQPMSFPSERARVAYVISYLSGRAEAWATAEWSRRSPVCDTLQLFTNALTKTFQQIAPGEKECLRLCN